MRDRHFMEDENELPYLVSETRDVDEMVVLLHKKLILIMFLILFFHHV